MTETTPTAYESLLEDFVRTPSLVKRFRVPPRDDPSLEDLHAAFDWLRERLSRGYTDQELLALLWRFAEAVEHVALALLVADHTSTGEEVWREMLASTWLNHIEEPHDHWQEYVLHSARTQISGEG